MPAITPRISGATREALAWLRISRADRLDVVLVSIVLVTSLLDEVMALRFEGIVGDFPPVLAALATFRFPRAGTVALALWSLLCAAGVVPFAWRGIAGLTGYVVIQSLVRRGRGRLAAAYTVVYVLAGTFIFVSLTGDRQPWPGLLLVYTALAAATWAGGHWLRSVGHAYEAQHSLALVEQRRAIARELHDGVAQQLSHIIMRTEQVRLHGRATDDDITFIHDTCQASVQDLRAMLTLLRSSEKGGPMHWADSAPGVVASLTEAEERLRSHGFDVQTQVNGDPDAVTGTARATFAAALYELTTNVIKHGRPERPCRILVEIEPEALEAAVLNTPTPPKQASDDEQRLGLIGLHERVNASGGTLETRRGAAQWIARLVLPLSPKKTEVDHD